MTKDFLGNIISIGDEIAYKGSSMNYPLLRAVVTKIDDAERIQILPYKNERKSRVNPLDCIIVTSLINEENV